MTWTTIIVLLLVVAGCVSVAVETPCADGEVSIRFPNVWVRTCTTQHDPIPPQQKEVKP